MPDGADEGHRGIDATDPAATADAGGGAGARPAPAAPEPRDAGAGAARIRPATDADGEAIAAIMRTVFADYPHCFFLPEEVPELAAVASHYRAHGGNVWVATEPAPGGGERVVGSLACAATTDPATFEIFKVYLLHAARGRGLGARMLEAALAHARAAGARRLRLWSDTKFVEGHAFYRRNGFRRIAAVRFLNDVSLTWEYGFVRPVDPAAGAGP
jgi:putative acetyltransferase